MTPVVGVVFSPGGKVYSFDPDGLELAWNTRVVCQTARGPELGRVVQIGHEPETPPVEPLRKILRRAGKRDEDAALRNRERGRGYLRELRAVLREHGITGVRPLAAEVSLDGQRATLSYRSEERVELRQHASELSRRLGVRVELRQQAPREGARVCGGVGLCGGRLCCTRFPSHEQPVTLRMAKDQELPMNPGRITGLCGRLRCCLAFEHPIYRSFRDRAPAVGRSVTTPQGTGVVRSYKVPEDSLVVRLDDSEQEIDVRVDDAAEVTPA